jgi:hypothetical protein
VPTGTYAIRQDAAAAVGPKDEMLKKQVVPTAEAIEKVEVPKSARKA